MGSLPLSTGLTWSLNEGVPVTRGTCATLLRGVALPTAWHLSPGPATHSLCRRWPPGLLLQTERLRQPGTRRCALVSREKVAAYSTEKAGEVRKAAGPSGTKMQLLETEFSRTVQELVELHLLRQDSIPAFLSALTLDLFSRQTVA
ncbi:hypothetical protein CB1_000114022 [Camelus ferus]|nr:hypothetical protein CB1_000114022 [Camelus ferus]